MKRPAAAAPDQGEHRADILRGHSRRTFLAYVATATLSPQVAWGQTERLTPVLLYTVGEETSELFRRSLRDALHGLPVALTIEHADTRDDAGRPSGYSLCLIVAHDAEMAEILRVRADGTQHSLRRVPLRGRLDAAARAAIGHIVRTTVESVIRLARRR